jgi:hypothetical protein
MGSQILTTVASESAASSKAASAQDEMLQRAHVHWCNALACVEGDPVSCGEIAIRVTDW